MILTYGVLYEQKLWLIIDHTTSSCCILRFYLNKIQFKFQTRFSRVVFGLNKIMFGQGV